MTWRADLPPPTIHSEQNCHPCPQNNRSPTLGKDIGRQVPLARRPGIRTVYNLRSLWQMVIMPASGSRHGGTALALQGGGSHGAFTWGVHDALFESGFKPDAVSGVSSGAILAAMAAQGFAGDGQDGARSAMAKFWNRVAATDWLTPITKAFGHWLPGFEIGRDVSNTIPMQGLSAIASMFGPLSVNPLGQNPLRPILAGLPPASRLNTERAFLDRLFLAGRTAHRAAEAA